MIDVDTVNARVRQFEIANGDDGIVLDNCVLFSNGAKRDANPLGALIPPPTDPRDRARHRVVYYEEQLRRAVERFNQQKATWLAHANANLQQQLTPPPPCDPNEAVRALKTLQAVVQQCQGEVAAARKEYEDAKTPYQRQREAQAVEDRQRNELFVAAIAGIKI